jgi:urease accessory protein
MSVLELMLADARTPTGGYAHSGGLEAMLAGCGPASDVPAFIAARLATVGSVDAAVAVAARAAKSLQRLAELDLEWAARTPAEPLRRAASSLGRGLLRSASIWFDGERRLDAYRAVSELTPRPVVLGMVARAGRLTPVAVARASLYDDAAAVAAAAVKLMALDAAVASGWVLALGPQIAALAADAVRDPARIPSTSTPLLDQRALLHAHTERRLFAS